MVRVDKAALCLLPVAHCAHSDSFFPTSSVLSGSNILSSKVAQVKRKTEQPRSVKRRASALTPEARANLITLGGFNGISSL